MSDKKVKIKVKKKRINFKRLITLLLILSIILITISYIINIPIKNIYVIGNDIISDKEIIKEAKIDSYPPIIKTNTRNIEKILEKNVYIKNVSVKKKLSGKIYLYVEEEKPLFIYNNKLVLTNGKQVENEYMVNYVPIIKNSIDDIYEKTISSFSKINKEALIKISEVEYKPNDLDKERFLLTMNDANYVYINLLKIEKINKYNTISGELNGKKGIIYLDSGDYVELKD